MNNKTLLHLAILKLLEEHDANFYAVSDILSDVFLSIIEDAERALKPKRPKLTLVK